MKRLAFVCVLAALFSGTASRAGLPVQGGPLHQRLPGGRHVRHHRPPAGRAVLQAARQVRRGRQQGGRLGHDRRRGDREVGAGRPHHPARLDGDDDGAAADGEDQHRHRQGPDDDRQRRQRLQYPRGRPRHALPELAGRREGGEGEPGEGDLRHGRLGLEPAALLRAVHGADRHQAHPGALSRRRAGDRRHDRRPGRPDVGQHAGVHGPDPRRRPAPDRLRRRLPPRRCCPRCR